jgi:Ca2+-binding RTX toxin-like protein
VVEHLFTTDTTETTGGADNVHGNGGDDIVLGGVNNGAADVLFGDAGNDMVLGDNGEFIYNGPADPDLGTLDIVRTLRLPADALDGPSLGGGDVISGDAGADLVLAGTGNDTGSGGTGDDVMFGDFAEVTLLGNQLDTLRSTDLTQGGSDVLYGNEDDDVIVGGAVGDFLDGDQDDDLVFGDAVRIHRRPEDPTDPNLNIANPRFQALRGQLLYGRFDQSPTVQGGTAPASGDESGQALVNGVAQAYRQPAGDPPSWAEYEVIDLRHSADLEAHPDGSFGGDYIAGGTGNDQIFGQLGDDVVQGDGSIDSAVDNDPATKPVGAYRTGAGTLTLSPTLTAPSIGTLVVNPSFETDQDGDDYVEGNGGKDVLFGNLGQDDLVGGSSDLFTLNSPDLRPDAEDFVFGGAGTRIARNVEVTSGDALFAERHARDADAIAGDNADIFRVVPGAGTTPLRFYYDNPAFPGYSESRPIVVRAVQFLDYTPGGPDFDAAAAAANIGAADEVHGESGDDQVYGMKGNDVLFGDGGDDDLIGGYGKDWASGGTGDDAVLGDDGRVFTSRNGTPNGEPLYGVAAIPAAELNLAISTPGKLQQATINVAGALKKAVDLTPFNLTPKALADDPLNDPAQADDVLFGGLGNDAVHGGAGDDAISGAEAIGKDSPSDPVPDAQDYFNRPINLGAVTDLLRFNPTREEFADYSEYTPLPRIDPFVLNFRTADGPAAGAVHTDGNDVLFGDLGNDWMVGGTGRDNMYGGWGDDLLNADDDQGTHGGLNDGPDTDPTYEDRAFGGAGRDVLIGNTGGDRLIDWVGEFNSYIVPFSPFGVAAISRTIQPQLPEYLYALSKSDGADPSRAADALTDPARNGEPHGELGVIVQQDAFWRAQTGAPGDPQAGNLSGVRRDVLRSANFDTGAAGPLFADTGTWTVTGGQYVGSAAGDAFSLINVDEYVPTTLELLATVNLGRAGAQQNGFIVFDYHGPTDFKYAGVDGLGKLRIGRRTAAGWADTASANDNVRPGGSYAMKVTLDGTKAKLSVGNSNLTYTFADPLTDGDYGLGLYGATTGFDDVKVQKPPVPFTYTATEDFSDGVADRFTPRTGQWVVADGRYAGTPGAGGDAVTSRPLAVAATSYVEYQATVNTTTTAGLVYDYYGPTDFKYAAVVAGANQVVLGHRTAQGWFTDSVVTRTVTAGADNVLLVALSGRTATVALNGATAASFTYNTVLNDGGLGLFARTGAASFDNVIIRGDDPAYTGGATPLLAAAVAPTTTEARPLTNARLRPIVKEAMRRWVAAGVDPAGLRGLTVRIADLPGAELGETVGRDIRIDPTAAGWGWFVDKTPRKDTEFTLAGDQGEQHRMDLLTAVMHEIGHVLGKEHEPTGLMAEQLQPGDREKPAADGLPAVTRQLPALPQDSPTHAAPLPPVKVSRGGWFFSRFFRR